MSKHFVSFAFFGALYVLLFLQTGIIAADVPASAPAGAPMPRVIWIGKTADWTDGAHDYTGPTTVSSGTLLLLGSVAGDVIVRKGAKFVLKGIVNGDVQVDEGGILVDDGGHVAGKITRKQP